MRPIGILFAFALLAGLGFMIWTAGEVAELPPRTVEKRDDAQSPKMARNESSPLRAVSRERPSHVRPIAPSLVAPPQLEADELVRVEPRGPLGELGQASATLPGSAGGWVEKLLHRPVATTSSSFSAMGYNISIAGVNAPDPNDVCSEDGLAWPCGARAVTAFRSWLQGRALSCIVPPEPGPAVIVTSCKLGEVDAGDWLVSNGWAHAVPDGPYSRHEEVARAERNGLFGPPPEAMGFVPAVDPTAPSLLSDDWDGLGIFGIEGSDEPRPRVGLPALSE